MTLDLPSFSGEKKKRKNPRKTTKQEPSLETLTLSKGILYSIKYK